MKAPHASEQAKPVGNGLRIVERKRKAIRMLKISSRHSHFIFGVLQAGLTGAIAAAIASIPFVEDGMFVQHWLEHCVADHAAGCRGSGAIHSLALGANYEVSVVLGLVDGS
jgi:hypothetical protein